MGAVIVGVLIGYAAGAMTVLICDCKTDNRMREIEAQRAERRRRREEQWRRRREFMRRGKKLWIWA